MKVENITKAYFIHNTLKKLNEDKNKLSKFTHFYIRPEISFVSTGGDRYNPELRVDLDFNTAKTLAINIIDLEIAKLEAELIKVMCEE